MTYILFFLIPLIVWIVIARFIFSHHFSAKEMSIQLGVTSLVIAFLFGLGYHSKTHDLMMINGVVTEKEAILRNCPTGWVDHIDSFCTNYRTREVKDGETCKGTGAEKVCADTYKTQYNYDFPWEKRYFVNSTVKKFEIKRVDSQGRETPPRFAKVENNDPVTDIVSYTNYIKGASATLFNQKFTELPSISYPKQYDYYHVNRVIPFSIQFDSEYISEWNSDLMRLNADIHETKANVIIVLTGEEKEWAEKLSQAWDAHNINDVVITIGTDTNYSIRWVDVRSWSSSDIVNVVIRDEILKLDAIDRNQINEIVYDTVVQFYEPQSIEDFAYLTEDILPPKWAFILAGIILLIVTPLTTLYYSKPNKHL